MRGLEVARSAHPQVGIKPVAPAHLPKAAQALQRLPARQLGEIELSGKLDLLVEVTAAHIGAASIDHPIVDPDPSAAKLEPAILERVANAKPVAAGVFARPPLLEPRLLGGFRDRGRFGGRRLSHSRQQRSCRNTAKDCDGHKSRHPREEKTRFHDEAGGRLGPQICSSKAQIVTFSSQIRIPNSKARLCGAGFPMSLRFERRGQKSLS